MLLLTCLASGNTSFSESLGGFKHVYCYIYLKYSLTAVQKSLLLQLVSKSEASPYFIGSGCRHPVSVNGHAISFPISQTILPRGNFFSKKNTPVAISPYKSDLSASTFLQ